MSKKDFSIVGARRQGSMESPEFPVAERVEEKINEFVTGQEPLTTMTFQLPTRLHTELKSFAVASRQKVKDILIHFIQDGLGRSK